MYTSELLTLDHAIALSTCSWQADGSRYARGTAGLTKEEEITPAGTRLRSLLALGKAEEDAHILVLQVEHTRPMAGQAYSLRRWADPLSADRR